MRNFASVVVVSCLVCFTSIAQEFTVESWGVQVVQKTYGKTKFGAELTPFNSQDPGIQIALGVTMESGGIIDVDKDNCKFTTLVDDRKTALHEVKSKFGDNVRVSFPKISEDGKAAMLPILCSGIPDKAATRLNLKGELALYTGTNTKSEESAETAFKEGSKFSVGDYSFTVEKAGEARFGDGFEIQIKTNRELDDIASFQFSKSDGTVVETKVVGSSRMGFGKKVTTTRTLRLDPLEKGVLTIKVWTDRKKVIIPINHVIALGGGKAL